jgi:toxin-antitoxin system PIN domain toxin
MILIDTNLLVYAYVREMPEHGRAIVWLDEQFRRNIRIGLPWHSLLGFVRVVSNPRGFPNAVGVPQAWDQVRQWLGADNAWVPQPSERHSEVLDDIFSKIRVSSRFVMDAHLAALAIEHGLTLCSHDGGFARVPNLRWINPLASV